MIIDFTDLPKHKKTFSDKKTVLVGGCFDIFHFGHLVFLKKAKQKGEYLIVALEPDKMIISSKKRQPIHNQDQRAQILDSIKLVDLVVKLPYLKEDKEYFNLVETINPSIIAITEGDFQYENKKNQAQKLGAKLDVVTPVIKDFSSTKIKDYAPVSRS